MTSLSSLAGMAVPLALYILIVLKLLLGLDKQTQNGVNL